jgi:PRTRC genetic system protein E
MFKALMPLLAERKIHILLAQGGEGKVTLYIEPAKSGDKDEEAAFLTPIQVQATPEELDEKLPTLLKEWIEARAKVCASLQEALDASKKEMERRSEEAKQKAADKAKKPATSVKAPAPKAAAAKDKKEPAAVSGGAAIIGNGEEGSDAQGAVPPNAPAATATESSAPAPQAAAATVEAGDTVSLF